MIYKGFVRVSNPGVRGGSRPVRVVNGDAAACGGRLPVEVITDRAKRYRANSEACRPKGKKVCEYCGSTRNVEVGHKDGNEDNGRASNLAWTCKSCNAKLAVEHKRKGRGKRTRQFNPKKKRKAAEVPNLAQYVLAAASHKRGRRDAGGKVIHATPPAVRSAYAKQIWDRRRRRGTDKLVPF